MSRLLFHIAIRLAFVLCALASANVQVDNHEQLAPRASGTCTPINPPPQGETCGSRGQLTHPAISGDSQEVVSIDECRDLCARHGAHVPKPGTYPEQYGCYIFGYDESAHVCSLYFKTLAAMGFTQNASSSSTFNSLRCFNCPAVCPQAIGASILDNGGFEASRTLDGPWKTSGGNTTTPGHNSAQAFVCGARCSLSQIVQICPNETYRFTFAYKAAHPVTVSVVYGGNLEGYDSPLPATGASWGSARYWFKPLGLGVTSVGLSFTMADGLQVDDAVVTRVSNALEPAAGAPELVENGGFETGELAPFQFQSGGHVYHYSVVSPGLDGSAHAVQVVGRVTDDNDESYLNQRIHGLVNGTNYLLRLTAVKQGGNAEFPEVYIGGLFYDPPFPGGNRYDFSIPFQAHGESELLSVGYYYGPMLIDNISVKKLG
jgi:hypothetical protein